MKSLLLIRLPHCISPLPPPPVPEPPSISDGGMRFVGGASLGQEYMDTQPPQQLVASPQGVGCGREGGRREVWEGGKEERGVGGRCGREGRRREVWEGGGREVWEGGKEEGGVGGREGGGRCGREGRRREGGVGGREGGGKEEGGRCGREVWEEGKEEGGVGGREVSFQQQVWLCRWVCF